MSNRIRLYNINCAESISANIAVNSERGEWTSEDCELVQNSAHTCAFSYEKHLRDEMTEAAKGHITWCHLTRIENGKRLPISNLGKLVHWLFTLFKTSHIVRECI